VLKLRVAVCTHDQQVTGVVTDARIEMVYFEVGFAISFAKRKRANLTLSIK
jgi:hypothetical protein